jgi:hypothetical protein
MVERLEPHFLHIHGRLAVFGDGPNARKYEDLSLVTEAALAARQIRTIKDPPLIP